MQYSDLDFLNFLIDAVRIEGTNVTDLYLLLAQFG